MCQHQWKKIWNIMECESDSYNLGALGTEPKSVAKRLGQLNPDDNITKIIMIYTEMTCCHLISYKS